MYFWKRISNSMNTQKNEIRICKIFCKRKILFFNLRLYCKWTIQLNDPIRFQKNLLFLAGWLYLAAIKNNNTVQNKTYKFSLFEAPFKVSSLSIEWQA